MCVYVQPLRNIQITKCTFGKSVPLVTQLSFQNLIIPCLLVCPHSSMPKSKVTLQTEYEIQVIFLCVHSVTIFFPNEDWFNLIWFIYVPTCERITL